MKQTSSRTSHLIGSERRITIKYPTSKKRDLPRRELSQSYSCILKNTSRKRYNEEKEKKRKKEEENIVINNKLDLTKVPQHIAFILDGNRRWAKQQNKTSNFGHKQGAKNIKNLCNLCIKYGVKYLTLYCLSVENLNRSKQELKFLFSCIKQFLQKKNIKKLHENGINLSIIGDFDLLPKDVASAI